MEESIIKAICDNFNFPYIITVNVLTYLLITITDIINKDKIVTFWQKRIFLLCSIIIIGFVYYVNGINTIILCNSAIAAPVAWSWILKPIFAKANLDYKKIDDVIK